MFKDLPEIYEETEGGELTRKRKTRKRKKRGNQSVKR